MNELEEVGRKLDDLQAFNAKIQKNKVVVDDIMVDFRQKTIEAQRLFEQLKSKMKEMAKVADKIIKVERWELCVGYNERALVGSAHRRELAHILYEWGYLH